MIRVHHLNNSRSQRVLWLLEELEQPYEVTRYERDPDTMWAPETLRRVHPLGKSPVIEDDGRILAETGVIVDYLVSRYGPHLAPAADPGSDAHWRYRYWLHYAEGSAMSPLLMKLFLNRLGIPEHPVADFVARQLTLHLDYLEAALDGSSWFAGNDFSAADVMMSFPLEVAVSRAGLDASRPNLWGFLQRIHARSAYARALEQGGPYAFAG